MSSQQITGDLFPSANRFSSSDECLECLVTINILSDDVLLDIFHFFRLEDDLLQYDRLEDDLLQYDRLSRLPLSWWHHLVHVCRRWRSVIFAFPNTLDLKIVCTPRIRMDLLNIWPPLPIVITHILDPTARLWYTYEFNAAIVHHSRVCEIDVKLTRSQLQPLAQKHFPALTHLRLGGPFYGYSLALPDGFLGGSAPHLQTLILNHVSFPALPKLLLSATNLVRLALHDIPRPGYISPEVIVTHLAVLANLKSLTIEFKFFSSFPDQEHLRLPLPTRTVLPVLTHFMFCGVTEYLENLVARIDAPLLDFIGITGQFIFKILQLVQFMRRTTGLKLQALNEAHVHLHATGVIVNSLLPTQTFDEKEKFGLRISCEDPNWRFSSFSPALTSLFPSVYIVEHLYLYGSKYLPSRWQDIENLPWLELFHPFSAVKKLYVGNEIARCIAPALQELVGERATNVLPALESIFLDELQSSGPVLEGICRFVAARQPPITVSGWVRN